jgi:aspartyl-tRNA(Asn)/glutamyl-tRNA(Gln) amidotransferase subunit C
LKRVILKIFREALLKEKVTIEKVAQLARLSLSPEQKPEFEKHFSKVLDFFKDLQKVSTEGVEPMVTPHCIYTELRADEVRKDLSTEELLDNAPDVKDALFKVPPVV